MPDDAPISKPGRERLRGFAFVWVLNFLHAGLSLSWALYLDGGPLYRLADISFRFIGLTQFVYVLPLLISARRKGRKDFIFSAVLAACVTFLLSAPCMLLPPIE